VQHDRILAGCSEVHEAVADTACQVNGESVSRAAGRNHRSADRTALTGTVAVRAQVLHATARPRLRLRPIRSCRRRARVGPLAA
jgi:hypothetical protein